MHDLQKGLICKGEILHEEDDIHFYSVYTCLVHYCMCRENTESNSSTAEESKYPKITEKAVGVFDMENKKVKLNSGYDMPIVGPGTYALSEDGMNQIRALNRDEKHDWY